MIGIEEERAVLRVVRSGSLSGYQGNASAEFYGGTEIRSLEEEWVAYFGIKHAAACNSATSGLWAACNAIGLTRGDEVIVTPYSMTCSATVPLLFGAIPVFADIEPDLYCLDPKSIRKKITKRTKAVIVVNLFGMPADYDAINEMCHKRGIVVIEDSAQSIGAKHHGQYAGTLGDICVSSLNRHKHINCGEGGVVTTNDDEYDYKIRLGINHSEAVINDKERKGESVTDQMSAMVGMNLRMTELSAAVAREQLKKLADIVKVYQWNAYLFDVPVREGCTSSYYRYATMIPMNQCPDGFNFKQHYITPLLRLPIFRNLGYAQDQCPVCNDVEDKIWLAWMKHEV